MFVGLEIKSAKELSTWIHLNFEQTNCLQNRSKIQTFSFVFLQIYLVSRMARVFALFVDTKANTSTLSNDISKLNTCAYPTPAVSVPKSATPNSICCDISEKIIANFVLSVCLSCRFRRCRTGPVCTQGTKQISLHCL